MSEVHIRFLGFPEVRRSGRSVRPDTRKAIALLAYLVMAPATVPRATLATWLWTDEQDGAGALRRTLSALRKLVGAEHVEADREVVALRRSPGLTVDTDRFQAAWDRARAHRHTLGALCPACVAKLTEAVALYRGDFLSGFSLR